MADKELEEVRSEFVDKVTGAVIKQLLDDLLKDGILNDGERESVLEENNARADRARCLIDIVKKKGHRASMKMIIHLQKRDPELYSTLGLTYGRSAQPAAEPQMEQAWSTTLIRSTDEFWREKLNDIGVYRVTKESIKSRVALLITNIKFKHGKDRQGAEKDEQVMEKLLTELGYEVVKHTNLTGKEIDDALIKFSKHPKLRETDSVFVVIMSHGKQGSVIGVDSDEFHINDIYKHLDTENCQALLDKPKIIIIQACRGDKEGAVLISDGAKAAVDCDDAQQLGPSLSAGEEEIVGDDLRLAHREKDFSSLLSCTPDTKAWRHERNGSYLIQYIDEVVKTYACKDHIVELFTRVKGRFENCPAETRGQMAVTDRDSLTKSFYLFPGH